MAKIKWVFQDEQGTNLNRYIATNVNTGERITFDLLRGGNISIVGTPLNAEKLNELITSINSLYDKNIYFHNIQFEGQNAIINFQLISPLSQPLASSSVSSSIISILDTMILIYGNNFPLKCSGVGNDIIASSISINNNNLMIKGYSIITSQIVEISIQDIVWDRIVDNVQKVVV